MKRLISLALSLQWVMLRSDGARKLDVDFVSSDRKIRPNGEVEKDGRVHPKDLKTREKILKT